MGKFDDDIYDGEPDDVKRDVDGKQDDMSTDDEMEADA